MNKQELRDLMQSEGSSDVTYKIKGYNCLAVRHDLGFWCGYVYIPKEDLNAELIPHLQAYGGLNYQEQTLDYNVVGFDCCKAKDIVPYLYLNSELFNTQMINYRDLKFVKAEFESIIEQLIDGKYKIRSAKLDNLF